MRETFERWLSDGESWVGVFENHDLGHPQVGRRFALVYDNADFDKAECGKTRAPDTQRMGLGWRWILVAKCRSVSECMVAMGMEGK